MRWMVMTGLFLAFPMLGSSVETESTTDNVAEVVYRHPTLRAKNYNKFLLEPVTLKPYTGGSALSAEELNVLSTAFSETIKESFKNNKSGLILVEKKGPGVLVVKSEVSEFEPVRPKATGQGEVAVRFDGQGRGGNLLLTAVDAMSGETVVILREDLIGSKYVLGDDKKRLMNMLEAFRVWGKLLQMRLAELKGKN